MRLFGKKSVVLETEAEKAKRQAKDQLFKMVRGLLFNSQKNYKKFLHNRRPGETYKPNIIYYIHQGILYRIPR